MTDASYICPRHMPLLHVHSFEFILLDKTERCSLVNKKILLGILFKVNCMHTLPSAQLTLLSTKLEKRFPIQGEQAHSLNF